MFYQNAFMSNFNPAFATMSAAYQKVCLDNHPHDMGSPPSASQIGSRDWMTNVLALEKVNQSSLINVLKMKSDQTCKNSSSPQMNDFYQRGQTLPNKNQIKTEDNLNVKIEEPALVKKMKVENREVPVPQQQFGINMLSALVDKQIEKLPFQTSQTIKCFLKQMKPNQPESPQRFEVPSRNFADKPLKILAFKLHPKTQEVIYLVEWKERANGFKLKNSLVTKEELMRLDPNMIISYYEKQVANTFHKILA